MKSTTSLFFFVFNKTSLYTITGTGGGCFTEISKVKSHIGFIIFIKVYFRKVGKLKVVAAILRKNVLKTKPGPSPSVGKPVYAVTPVM